MNEPNPGKSILTELLCALPHNVLFLPVIFA